MRHLRYLAVVARHRWYVLVYGLYMGVPLWRLLVHDSSKFSRAEWGPYVRRFIGGRAGDVDHEVDPDEFHRAFAHHWHRNTHHWEHWVRFGKVGPVGLRMPQVCVREMIADWMAAGKVYGGTPDVASWYATAGPKMILHPDTRRLVEYLLEWGP